MDLQGSIVVYFITYSQTALLFLHSATYGTARIFACHIMIQTLIRRVAHDWDLGRMLYGQSYSAAASIMDYLKSSTTPFEVRDLKF